MKTEHVHLGVSRCGATGPRPGDEETESHYTMVFPLEGVFVRHRDGRRTVATPAVTVFCNPGEVQTVSHPTGGHDASLFIALGPRLVGRFVDRTERFPRSSVPNRPGTYLRVRRIARSTTIDPLVAEELAVTTLQEIDEAPQNTPAQLDLVADAEECIAAHLAERLGLVAIADRLGTSPHHLSRVFHAVTGSTLSGRRAELRVRRAVGRILDGADDIARVAVECGFYDHAHLTNSMRRLMGTTPSGLRPGSAGGGKGPGEET